MRLSGAAIVPLVVAVIALYGLLKGVDVFDCFVEGAKGGISVCFRILPTLIGMLTAIGMFRASGGLALLCDLLAYPAGLLGLPQELVPLALVRPLSGGLAMGVFRDILAAVGADSYIGKVASVMMGSTETTLYVIAVYYSAVNIKDTRHTLSSGLISDLTGFVMSSIAVRLFLL